MPKRNSLLPWWLGFGCIIALTLGLWLIRFGGAAELASLRSGSHSANPPAQSLRLPDLPPIAKPAMLIHLTVRKIQLFDANRLLAEYDMQPGHVAPAPAHAIINRKVTEGDHAPFVLLTDSSSQPQVLAILHADPLPADANLPGLSVSLPQLLQLIHAMPVGSPVTLLP